MKKYWKTLLITSLLTLLPVAVGLILWDQLPPTMAVHFGFDGKADGFGSIRSAVFGMPLLMLALHWLCVLLSVKLPGADRQNPKAIRLVLWIMPLISNLSCGMVFSTALYGGDAPFHLIPLGLGLLFAAIGNYLPKMRRNPTMGIRIPWTLGDEENWNATHRFGGKLWTFGGLLAALTALAPTEWCIPVMLAVMAVIIVCPIVYSYRFYRRKKAAGLEVTGEPLGKHSKYAFVAVAVILVFVGVLLLTGSLSYEFGPESFTVKASFYDDLTVSYDIIDSVEYRPGNVGGVRTFGFGSFRLEMGTFHNSEFGSYTRYTYYHPDGCIIVKSNGQTLVLSGRDAAQTQELYDTLCAYVNP